MAKLGFDPENLPVDSIGSGGAVPKAHLNPEWIKNRFSNPPVWKPEINAEQAFVHRDRWIPAAVLVPLVDRNDGLSLMLTQRALHMHDHPGQISFPGGRVDLTDSTRIETALREMEEEVGVDRSHVEILGTLPEYRTGSGYRVTPVVSIVTPPFDVHTNPDEVAEVFEVPFSFFMDGSNYQVRSAEFPNGAGKRTFYTVPYKNRFVWGATAGMLRNLYHFLKA
jgi:8-oxo-dGTP pyrophosphatase MutT (NUDIX family)